MKPLKKATQPNEIICFFPLEIDTVKDGKGYIFLAIDAYSEFMFPAGIERADNEENVLKQIERLLTNKEFNADRRTGFTLVTDDFEEHRTAIEKLIAPHGGVMVKDAGYIMR